MGSASSNPISTELEIDGKSVSMKVDTGAAVSIKSGATFAAHFPDNHHLENVHRGNHEGSWRSGNLRAVRTVATATVTTYDF